MKVKLKDTTKIAAIGDIHEHPEQFFKLLKQIRKMNDTILVSVGDVLDKGFGPEASAKILDALSPLISTGRAYIVRGNHELSFLNKARRRRIEDKYVDWIQKWPLSIEFEYENGAKYTVLHGGVTPKHTLNDLEHNVEIAYVRTVDEHGNFIPRVWKSVDNQKILVPTKEGKIWHLVYDGRFGYIISGHAAQKDGIAKFYNYSCNLDSACYATGVMTCQIFGPHGREELITVKGPTKNFNFTLTS